MLGTLIKKEIVTTVLDLRFVIASLLFLVLFPLGMYVSRKDYEQRLANHQLEHRMYRQKYGEEVSSRVPVQGFRPPPALSVFASGLDHYIPDRVITSRSGIFNTSKDLRAGDSPTLLFGQMDWLFNVCFVASLVALTFTFNSISGERQAGTLGLMLANPVSRSHILLSKIAGTYVSFLIPFVMSLLLASVILELSRDISILLPPFYRSFLIILAVTLAFILTMVTLGVLISAATRKPIISMTVSLFVWVIMVLALPKVSPMLARIIYPVEAEQVVNLRKHMALEDIEETYRQENIAIHNKYDRLPEELMLDYFSSKSLYLDDSQFSAEMRSVLPLDAELIDLAQANERRIKSEIGRIVQDHENKMDMQNAIAMNISRLSPACCYSYLVSGLANTGTREFDKFMENAQEFQDQVKKVVYDNYQVRVWKRGHRTSSQGIILRRPPDSVPDMYYRYASLAEVLEAGLIDVILLIGFTVLFFTLAFVAFNRCDVRS